MVIIFWKVCIKDIHAHCYCASLLCTQIHTPRHPSSTHVNMVGGMVQYSQSLYLFTFNAFIIIHEYIYSHLTTKFIFKKYINSHLTKYFLFTNIFTHIHEMYSVTFNGLYSFTFTIEILVQHGAIFIQHFLRTVFAHH